jgi:hypothetical protein
MRSPTIVWPRGLQPKGGGGAVYSVSPSLARTSEGGRAHTTRGGGGRSARIGGSWRHGARTTVIHSA